MHRIEFRWDPAGHRGSGESRAADPADIKTVLVPEGVAVYAQVPVERLTDRGRSRLEDGTRIRAGVLATVADYDSRDGELELATVAIFWTLRIASSLLMPVHASPAKRVRPGAPSRAGHKCATPPEFVQKEQ
jgi:hypothetical protein